MGLPLETRRMEQALNPGDLNLAWHQACQVIISEVVEHDRQADALALLNVAYVKACEAYLCKQ